MSARTEALVIALAGGNAACAGWNAASYGADGSGVSLGIAVFNALVVFILLLAPRS